MSNIYEQLNVCVEDVEPLIEEVWFRVEMADGTVKFIMRYADE